MPDLEQFNNRIFAVSKPEEFNGLALEIFHYQRKKNQVYAEFTSRTCSDPDGVSHFSQIPFLPISFFKRHRVMSGIFEPELVFQSSGTSGAHASRHHIRYAGLYKKSFLSGFSFFFGDVRNYNILALLPSYVEQGNSSLVYMAQQLVRESRQTGSGFFLEDYGLLRDHLLRLRDSKKKVLLLGVTYALLDLAAQYPLDFPELIIMETGGMKGRRKEMVREEVQDTIKEAFHVPRVYAEYGMTELLSQAYSKSDGLFETPPWMKVLIRDPNDPLTLMKESRTGGINIIDLANIHSCSFVASDDLGRMHPDGKFEVLGRFDHSDVRGCNLLLE